MWDMIDWWVNLNPLSEKEKELLFQQRFEEKEFVSDDEYNSLVEEYINRMPYSNITTNSHTITFADSGSEFINNIFNNNVDDDTLIIFSDAEHPSVLNKTKEYSHTLQLHYNDDILGLNFNKIINESKKYKKVFLYIIGTQISNGIITPQIFFTKLKEMFNKHNIEHTFVLDDVHGMFFVPRDYSIFDYILYTCHALINKYDMGILISKDGLLGEKIYNQGKQYLDMLDVILKRKDKVLMFYNVMMEYFRPLLATKDYELIDTNSRHLFSLKTNNLLFNEKIHDILTRLHIRLEGKDNKTNYILFRSARFIKNPEFLYEGLPLLEEYIKILTI